MALRELPQTEIEGESDFQRWEIEALQAEWEAEREMTSDGAPMVYVKTKEGQAMVTIIEVNHDTQTLFARTVEDDAGRGALVLPGKPTDQEIIDAANDRLPAPDLAAAGTALNYDDYVVEWSN